jgi:hypothetical protein
MGELIKAFFVSLALICIVAFNFLQVVNKDQLSEGLFLVGKGEAKLSHPLVECLLLGINCVGTVINKGNGCEKEDSCDLPSFHD